MRLLRQLVIPTALALAACGGAAGPGDVPSPSAPPSNVVVTAADNQKTVTAHVGDHVQIALGTQYDWKVDPPDGVVLVHPATQNYLLVRGTQAIWLANAVGRSTVRASGGVVCASGQPCPLLLAVFSATVEVVP
jgi:hypothetical protein